MRLRRSIPSFLLITLISMLIWLYAEGQDVASETREITLLLPQRVGQDRVVDFIVRGEGGETRRVASIEATVTFKGAAAPLSQLKAVLAGGQLQLPIEASDLTDQQRVTLKLDALLQRVLLRPDDAASQTIADLGLSVVTTDPGQVTVHVDQLVTRPVRVVFNPPSVQLKAGYRLDPAQVPLTLMQSQLDSIAGSEDALFFEAAISAAQLNAMPQDVQQEVSLPLRLNAPGMDQPHVRRRVDQGVITWPIDAASVTFTIARQRDSLKLDQSVPVWLIAPPNELKRFSVTLQEPGRVLTNVTIEGPRDLIDALRDRTRKLRVIARFELTSEQLERGATSVPLTSIEIIETVDGRSVVRHSVPLNPKALQPGVSPKPVTFLSPELAVDADQATVNFTIQRLGG